VGEGVEADKESRLGTHVRILHGRQLRNDDAYGVLLGEGAATAMKLVPGDRVTLLANTLAGAINTADFEVVGIFQSFSKDYDARAVRITLDAAHGLLNTNGINTLVISLKQTEYTPHVTDVVERQIDRRQLEVNTWQQLNDFYQSTVALYERQFGVLQLIILILVLLSVANSVNMSVFERVGEFGTMMALGNQSGTVFRLVLTENAVLGACGALLGVATGMILAQIISLIGVPMPPPPNANVGYTAHIRISASMLLTTFAITSCATVLAALIPARRVSRIRVAAALSQNY
jgi:putative ABC transport system permease protein